MHDLLLNITPKYLITDTQVHCHHNSNNYSNLITKRF